ncbi:siroheme synthase [Pseudoxanthomonas broegbernensis]|uniref:precorrin-2 dehydrogenase n=1 Tax=Pseudoxanthomonas broegbernensis TaxID=83619 RepID=A0A7V8K7S4_9GAMM|nr:NAD(P)-dependent oxidoreductase [Pseudoxanthomonas broegbernensis]KAF1686928.1 siroheme synthase [Pseudoxanthomonas broegbernensis]MBB6065474.1 precorrin-2 dehydrogenase/sirohydrochlorin ferrochelatase [Pseudoxanthomonas broegbernensis]
MALYPLFADLEGRDVLVVGGGEVAARKIAALLKAGARVRLHARAILHPDVAAALAAGRIDRLGGDFDPAWLEMVWLVVAATDDTAFNAALAVEAGTRRRLINVVDDAALSTFQVPAVVDRSPLVIAISSGGVAPMLARRVREQMETLLDPALGPLAALFGRYRQRIRQALPDMGLRRRWFERLLDGRLDRAHAAGGAGQVENAFLDELERAGEWARHAAGGAVALLAAAAMPDLYTLRALRVLNEADAIVLSTGVARDAIEPARRDALHLQVPDAEADGLALEHALGGSRVVYVHAGTPAGLAACARLSAACHEAGIACRDVPSVAAGPV